MKYGKKLPIIVLAFTLFACGTAGAAAISAKAEKSNAGTPADRSVEKETSSLMSTEDENGRTQYSEDGENWMTEAEYEKEHPESDVVWWTYEEYKAWLDNERAALPALIGQPHHYYDANGVLQKDVWTKEKIDAAILQYEQELERIKNGEKVSKTVDGDDNIGMSMTPPAEAPAVEHSSTVHASGGNTIDLGSYDTKEEASKAIRDYCEKQVKAGKMTQQEADSILGAE